MLSHVPDEHRLARAALTFLAEPGDPILGALVRATDPAEALRCIQDDAIPRSVASALGQPDWTLRRVLAAWRTRLNCLPQAADLAGFERRGSRLLCPGDREWPPALDDLGDTSPFALWLRGDLDLRACCARSVAIVGSRAATGYGAHVAGEIAADLAARGWTVISGTAYGIDAAAHRGALTVPDQGPTIAVLASGVNRPYPAGHSELLATIAGCGLVISDSPPDRLATRTRFTARNRIIAALSAATVIVEAGTRSGTMNTARHAVSLGRPLLAVPGPVTSPQSAGCHQLLQSGHATCVTDADDIITVIRPSAAAQARNYDPFMVLLLRSFAATSESAGTRQLDGAAANTERDRVLGCSAATSIPNAESRAPGPGRFRCGWLRRPAGYAWHGWCRGWTSSSRKRGPADAWPAEAMAALPSMTAPPSTGRQR